jgi:hypothetical protein
MQLEHPHTVCRQFISMSFMTWKGSEQFQVFIPTIIFDERRGWVAAAAGVRQVSPKQHVHNTEQLEMHFWMLNNYINEMKKKIAWLLIIILTKTIGVNLNFI